MKTMTTWGKEASLLEKSVKPSFLKRLFNKIKLLK